MNTGDRCNRFSLFYQVYGLTVQSELELPELSSITQCNCEATVRFGDVPEFLSDEINDFDWISYSSRRCLIRIENIGRFLVENGKTITIDRRLDRFRKRGTGVHAADVRAFLLGSAFGALLHQRDFLPLHVSAVESPGGTWAFTGDSGAGKSTIAGWMHRRYNWPMISDDVSVIRPEFEEALLFPGPRKLKLWEDAVKHLGCKEEKLVRDLSNTPKFQLYLSDRTQYQPKAMQALVALERCSESERPRLEKLKGAEALRVIMEAVYRPYMAEWFRDSGELMHNLIKLCNQVDVYRFRRRWSLDQMEAQLTPLIDRIREAERLGIS